MTRKVILEDKDGEELVPYTELATSQQPGRVRPDGSSLVVNSNGVMSVNRVTGTELGYLSGVTSAIQGQLNGKQSTLVSGTNIKSLNGASLLGSGNITIKDGKVIRVTKEIADITWNTTSEGTYGATYYGEVIISNTDIEANKSYMPIVLFSDTDTVSTTHLLPQCFGSVQSAGQYRLLIYANPDYVGTPSVAFYFRVILIEITNDYGDSLVTSNRACQGLTNANGRYNIVKVGSLPSSLSSNTIYLIPES